MDEAQWRRQDPGKLEKKLIEDFGSIEKMKEDFIQAGVTQFGSGWHWLAVQNGRIITMKSPNGESPLVHGATPILGNDVWEHSYYIDYRNRRPDYCKASSRTSSTGSMWTRCFTPPSPERGRSIISSAIQRGADRVASDLIAEAPMRLALAPLRRLCSSPSPANPKRARAPFGRAASWVAAGSRHMISARLEHP